MTTPRQYLLTALFTLSFFSLCYYLLEGDQFYDALLLQLIVLWLICEMWYFALWVMSLMLLMRHQLTKSLEYNRLYRKGLQKWNRRTAVMLLLAPHVIYVTFYFIAQSPDTAATYPKNPLSDDFILSSYLSCVLFYILSLFFRMPPISIVAWVRSAFSSATFPLRN